MGLLALLDSVKVTLPDQGTIPLSAVASVTIKQGTLYVEVWDTDVSSSWKVLGLITMITDVSGNETRRICTTQV